MGRRRLAWLALAATVAAMAACSRTELDAWGPDAVPDDARAEAAPVDAPSEVSVETGCGQTGLTVLATDQNQPAGIAVDAKFVYWTNPFGPAYDTGTVMRVPIDGCNATPTTLASAQGSPQGIAVSSTALFWTNWADWTNTLNNDHGNVMTLTLDGGTPAMFASNQNGTWAVAIGPDGVYWTDTGDGLDVPGSVLKCPFSGCNGSPMVITSTQGGVGVAVDDANVYWTYEGVPGPTYPPGTGAVLKCPITGCSGPPTVLASGLAVPGSIAVDATSVYWVNQHDGTLMKCAIAGCAGSPTVLYSGLSFGDSIAGIATDGTNVYVTSPGANLGVGLVLKIPVGGGSPMTLASGQAYPTGIAVDGTSVYWTNGSFPLGTGTVVKLTPK